VGRDYIPIGKDIESIAINTLETIYSTGVIDPADLTAMGTSPEAGITMLIGNIAYDIPTTELLTIEQALDFFAERIGEETQEELFDHTQPYSELNMRSYIRANLIPDELTSSRVKAELLRNLSLTKGMVSAGEKIISKGEVVTTDLFLLLESLRREYESRLGVIGDIRLLIFGQALLVSIIFLVLYLFLRSFRREILDDHSKIIFILLLISIMVLVSSLAMKFDAVSIYLIPFAIVPVFIRAFYDSRLALFTHLITVFMVGFFVPNSFEFVFMHFIAGIVAIISLTNFYRRGKLFLTVALVLVTYWLLYFGMVTLQEGTPMALNPIRLLWFFGNALLLLASYQLIYLLEKIFGFVSDTTLMELSDTNQMLLRQLAEVAPGSFQHSLQVANLAEAAIFQIGGNPLLIRAGALYHDIGKMSKPFYFIENQSPDFNPHQSLDFEESAQIIIEHIQGGVQLAKKERLPKQLIDFIRTHHGTTRVEYFFRLFKEKFPNLREDFSKFAYPGPIPSSREMAVLMMADSVEAASRALKNITQQTIDNLVENIINYQQIEGQYDDADLTFKDITSIKRVFKKKLMNIYHARIEYPKSEDEVEKDPKGEISS